MSALRTHYIIYKEARGFVVIAECEYKGAPCLLERRRPCERLTNSVVL
ncbi:hypothetical protein GCWU000325_01291 [Alloprevotella tannerae ATCC 51259]|uniref:Uncharacterized protein n=1 Tax=Alloprevotella tannerae ATCC 51259 TaxID=626522 RepID=C9LGE8_9BACT|nr:hypothetical protein GCWU000325_01291 [Alloprevotella tannerae ATCC 51259]